MELLSSKRFWSGAIGLLVLIVTNISPEIGRLFADIQEGVVAIVLALITAYGAQDVVREWRSGAKG